MKSGQGVSVLDPYSFLPGYGENRVEVHTCGLRLQVEIQYDGKDGLPDKKSIVFDGVAAFEFGSFPGVKILDIDYEVFKEPVISGMIEYPGSELAVAWRRHFPYQREIKHYSLIFTNANQGVTVFAVKFALHGSDFILK